MENIFFSILIFFLIQNVYADKLSVCDSSSKNNDSSIYVKDNQDSSYCSSVSLDTKGVFKPYIRKYKILNPPIFKDGPIKLPTYFFSNVKLYYNRYRLMPLRDYYIDKENGLVYINFRPKKGDSLFVEYEQDLSENIKKTYFLDSISVFYTDIKDEILHKNDIEVKKDTLNYTLDGYKLYDINFDKNGYDFNEELSIKLSGKLDSLTSIYAYIFDNGYKNDYYYDEHYAKQLDQLQKFYLRYEKLNHYFIDLGDFNSTNSMKNFSYYNKKTRGGSFFLNQRIKGFNAFLDTKIGYNKSLKTLKIIRLKDMINGPYLLGEENVSNVEIFYNNKKLSNDQFEVDTLNGTFYLKNIGIISNNDFVEVKYNGAILDNSLFYSHSSLGLDSIGVLSISLNYDLLSNNINKSEFAYFIGDSLGVDTKFNKILIKDMDSSNKDGGYVMENGEYHFYTKSELLEKNNIDSVMDVSFFYDKYGEYELDQYKSFKTGKNVYKYKGWGGQYSPGLVKSVTPSKQIISSTIKLQKDSILDISFIPAFDVLKNSDNFSYQFNSNVKIRDENKRMYPFDLSLNLYSKGKNFRLLDDWRDFSYYSKYWDIDLNEYEKAKNFDQALHKFTTKEFTASPFFNDNIFKFSFSQLIYNYNRDSILTLDKSFLGYKFRGLDIGLIAMKNIFFNKNISKNSAFISYKDSNFDVSSNFDFRQMLNMKKILNFNNHFFINYNYSKNVMFKVGETIDYSFYQKNNFLDRPYKDSIKSGSMYFDYFYSSSKMDINIHNELKNNFLKSKKYLLNSFTFKYELIKLGFSYSPKLEEVIDPQYVFVGENNGNYIYNEHLLTFDYVGKNIGDYKLSYTNSVGLNDYIYGKSLFFNLDVPDKFVSPYFHFLVDRDSYNEDYSFSFNFNRVKDKNFSKNIDLGIVLNYKNSPITFYYFDNEDVKKTYIDNYNFPISDMSLKYLRYIYDYYEIEEHVKNKSYGVKRLWNFESSNVVVSIEKSEESDMKNILIEVDTLSHFSTNSLGFGYRSMLFRYFEPYINLNGKFVESYCNEKFNHYSFLISPSIMFKYKNFGTIDLNNNINIIKSLKNITYNPYVMGDFKTGFNYDLVINGELLVSKRVRFDVNYLLKLRKKEDLWQQLSLSFYYYF